MLKRSEIEVVQEFKALALPHFALLEEVWMKHIDGHNLRIDFLAKPRDPENFPVKPRLIGFEIKRDHEEFKTYSKALKQAIDYRHASVKDIRCPDLAGVTPMFIFVYPPYEHDMGWSGGADRLAGRYNVGTASVEENWRGEEALTLRCAGTRIWDSLRGPQGGIERFGSNRGRGSK